MASLCLHIGSSAPAEVPRELFLLSVAALSALRGWHGAEPCQKTVQGGMGPASWLLSGALSQPL